MYIKVENIKKSFGKKNVLKGVSFTAEPGESVAILGQNGSGKSTLFGVLTGLQKGEGKFICNEHDLIKESELRSRVVGFVPQNPPLIAELSAKDNLRLWYAKDKLEKELDDGVLKLLGIPAFYNTPVRKMSGGMKKRLSIGCAIAHDPRVLFLDEPSAALDILAKERITEYLSSFKSRGGIAIIATHDAYQLELCDKLYILKNGIVTPYNESRKIHDLVGCLKDE